MTNDEVNKSILPFAAFNIGIYSVILYLITYLTANDEIIAISILYLFVRLVANILPLIFYSFWFENMKRIMEAFRNGTEPQYPDFWRTLHFIHMTNFTLRLFLELVLLLNLFYKIISKK